MRVKTCVYDFKTLKEVNIMINMCGFHKGQNFKFWANFHLHVSFYTFENLAPQKQVTSDRPINMKFGPVTVLDR